MKKIILFTLLLFSLSFSANLAEVIEGTTASYIVILLVFTLAGLTYMAGSLFSSPKFSARAKDMLYQGIFSLIIMATFPVIYVVFDTIFKSLFLGGYSIPPDVTMFELSENLLYWNYIFYFIHLVLFSFLNMYVLTFFGRSYNVPIADRFVPFDLTILQTPLLFLINSGVSLITLSLMINGFQILFLNFVRYVLIQFLLPIGLILRAFPSSMHAGNVLVGVSIGAFIIVPMVYAIDLQMLPTMLSDESVINDEDFRAYNSFALMNSFYSKEVLENVVVNSQNCYLVEKTKDFMDIGLVDIDYYSKTKETAESPECDVQYGEAFSGFFGNLPGYMQVIGVSFVGTASMKRSLLAIEGSINFAKGLFNKEATPQRWATRMFDRGWGKIFGVGVEVGAVLFLTYLFYELTFSFITSFIILSVIMPFIKFTIIILFIREFTLNFLGTQVSLEHVARLI